MISYGGINLTVPTPELAGMIERGLSSRDMQHFERADWPGPTRIAWGQPDMPRLPAVKLGVLHWPRDAQRFAVYHGLVTTNQVSAIRLQVASAYQALALEISQEDGAGNTIANISTDLWMLPPRPVRQISGANGLYLLTLVDDRYWWPLRDTGEIPVTAGTTTWASLYSSLGTALGVTIQADTINSAYLQPSTALTARYENSAVLLDTVARNVGQRIVRDLAGNVWAYNVTSSQSLMASNLTQIGTSAAPLMAGGTFAFTPGIPNDLPSVLPGTVRVTFPRAGCSCSEDVYAASVSLASLNLNDLGTTGNANTKTFHDACTAGGSNTPTNLSELTALTTQQATDWYRYRVAPVDCKLAGIVALAMEGLSDSVEWTYRKSEVSTRIQRPAWNDRDEQLLHASTTITPASAAPGSCCGGGGVNLQTSSYTFQSSDDGELVTFSSASALTGTLPNPPTLGPCWRCAVESRGAGTLTLQPGTLAPPAAPTLNNSTTGGTLTAGTYQVEVSYVNAQGETTASASASIAIVSGEKLTINSPAASGSGSAAATGWYAYVTQAGGSTYTRQQTAGSPTAIGTNLVLSANPTNTGTNPPGTNTAADCLIDGAASLSLAQNQGCWIFTDGLNYYTERGMGSGGGGGTSLNAGVARSSTFTLTSGAAHTIDWTSATLVSISGSTQPLAVSGSTITIGPAGGTYLAWMIVQILSNPVPGGPYQAFLSTAYFSSILWGPLQVIEVPATGAMTALSIATPQGFCSGSQVFGTSCQQNSGSSVLAQAHLHVVQIA